MIMKPITILALFALMTSTAQEHYNLIVGTYTNACKSDGIYVYDFNIESSEYKLKSHTEKVINPSYFTISSDKKWMYSVNENGKDKKIKVTQSLEKQSQQSSIFYNDVNQIAVWVFQSI